MPRGSYLINTARGQLVETAAVVEALERGQLAGAALDVLEVEPPDAAHPSPSHPRLIVTPHAAWYSPASDREVINKATSALLDALDGKVPAGILVPQDSRKESS
jgi:D-3-phosphoglycerate dehydrogenase